MKRLFWVTFFLMLISTSCRKEDASFAVPPRGADVQATVPETSRTVLDGMSVRWEQTDYLTIFWKTSLNRKYMVKTISEDGRTATYSEAKDDPYSGTGDETLTANFALYPYDRDARISGSVITTTIAAEHTYVAGSPTLRHALMVAQSEAVESLSFPFKNAGGILRVKVKKSESILEELTLQSIQVSSAGHLLAGKVTIDVAADHKAVVTEGVKEVSLVGINQTITTESDEQGFCLALPVTNFEAGDLTLTFVYADRRSSVTVPYAFELKQNTIKTINYTENAKDFTGTTPGFEEDDEIGTL